MKVGGVPSYFIIIFIAYSFKCSALSSYSPTAGRAAEPRRGQWKEAVKGGGGAGKHPLLRGGLTLSVLLYWPAGGALMLSLDKTSQPL